MNLLQKSLFLLLMIGSLCNMSLKAQQGKEDKRPNIVLIMADDLGYSDLGCYGGEIETPNLDRLAQEGLRYKQFYNAARCCPTRASLLTGLYPHQAGMGWMAAADLGTPAYQGNLSDNSVTIAEVLKAAGYGTYMTGKWHVTNERKIDGMVIDNWPKQRGFDHYFGIIPGGANYFTPVIYTDNHQYKAPDNFFLTDAISDSTVKYIHQHFNKNADSPMFMYVAYTAPHWPLHALQNDIDKYKEFYKVGWDVVRKNRFEKQQQIGLFSSYTTLSPRDTVIKDWKSLSNEKKNEMAMRMAIYAAQIDNMDQGVGRILEALKAENQLDNTLIFFLSDNGACAEFISSGKRKEVDGKEDTFESYRVNWANVSSTPFREYKHYTNEGGIATPLIIHWPKGIDENLYNSFVTNYGHISDIMATCVDVSQTSYPVTYKGKNIHSLVGKSLKPHFNGNNNNRGKIFWEHEANIAVRDGKWKLVTKTRQDAQLDEKNLSLYDMDTDPTEMNNLSARYPDKVKEMYHEWINWGNEIGVFPLDTRNYNVRAQLYRRKINGNFDDNLGGWEIRKTEGVQATVCIDTTYKLTGKKSAFIQMEESVDKSSAFTMFWSFQAKKGEQFDIKINSVASRETVVFIRLENSDPKKELKKMMDSELVASTRSGKNSFRSIKLPRDGSYRLSIDMGMLQGGDKLWIDDVEILAVKK
ncbi:arylsulfatase [Sphingobacterium phlebotomi]|uniref:Arylsulfatase n=2 Tax=Sphingobacterium phlebotomi TaxID=2605433 RepID=A0A5D4H9I6_9SPHI|nr:arylsulfatase [Sphingobacterium phlebotomi]